MVGNSVQLVKGLLLNHATTFLWIVELTELLIIFFSALIIWHLIYFNQALSYKC
jgi:hypothetical protein